MGCDHLCDFQDACIRKVPIFSDLSKEEVHRFQEAVHSKIFAKGQFIFRQGEKSKGLFVLSDGLVKLTILSTDGKEQILRILYPGDFFGQYALLENKTYYANAEALRQTTVCMISKEEFLKIIGHSPKTMFQFLLSVNQKLHESEEWIGARSFLEVEQRLTRYLLYFYQKNNHPGQAFNLPIPKKDFAALIGTTPETLSRKLVGLKKRNIISLEGPRGIKIIDETALQAMVGDIGR
nr:Crp/Fnr family transcriptional regulator [Evansella caseinilytica]